MNNVIDFAAYCKKYASAHQTRDRSQPEDLCTAIEELIQRLREGYPFDQTAN